MSLTTYSTVGNGPTHPYLNPSMVHVEVWWAVLVEVDLVFQRFGKDGRFECGVRYLYPCMAAIPLSEYAVSFSSWRHVSSS